MRIKYSASIVIICLFISHLAYGKPPSDKSWHLVFSDNFTGTTLDLSKWEVENFSPGHILSSRWTENIILINGICQLITLKQSRGGKEWTSAHMWSKNFAPLYGYFEANIKYAGANGLNNAFWLMPLPKNGSVDFEIDINEGKYPNKIDTNMHNWKGKHTQKQISLKLEADLSKGFHLYALEWNKDELIWYIDNKVIRREKNQYNSRGANVRFSTAVMAALAPEGNLHNKSMDIDYVHVYQLDY